MEILTFWWTLLSLGLLAATVVAPFAPQKVCPPFLRATRLCGFFTGLSATWAVLLTGGLVVDWPGAGPGAILCFVAYAPLVIALLACRPATAEAPGPEFEMLAVFPERSIYFVYRDAEGGETEWDLGAREILEREGALYIGGKCLKRNDRHIIRVDHIQGDIYDHQRGEKTVPAAWIGRVRAETRG